MGETVSQTMKCVVCGLRKGKRDCPAKNGPICAPCCGEKRVIEIACPADCPHLANGQTYHGIKHVLSLLNHEESPARRVSLYETVTEWMHVIEEIEKTIVVYASDLRALRDTDISQAVEAVRKTCESEERGFFFEHSSPNPLAQSLARELQARIEELKAKPSAPDLPVPKNVDVVRCLQLVEAKIRRHAAEDRGPRPYLAFIARSHPGHAVRSGKGSLVIP